MWFFSDNYDPFFTSSFNHNFGRNDNQTFNVSVESTLVLYRKGLCGFSLVLKFPLEEKLCCAKYCEYFRPEGVHTKKTSFDFMAATSGRKPGQRPALVPHNMGLFAIAFPGHCGTTHRTQELFALPAPSKSNP